MNERDDERIDELIALAALGELTELEERELDALLADDIELTAEVDAALDTAAQLQATRAEAPPARLAAAVFDAISTAPQLPASESASAPVVSAGAADDVAVIDLSARRRSRWAPLLSAAAALVLLAGVGLVVVGGDSGSGDDPRALQVENVVAADDAVERRLEGDLEGTLTVVYSAGEAAIVIDGDGLPVLGDDRAFVLWFVDDGSVTPVQTFRPDASGDVLVRVDDVDPTDFVLGITEEDAGGSDTPTLPILASA